MKNHAGLKLGLLIVIALTTLSANKSVAATVEDFQKKLFEERAISMSNGGAEDSYSKLENYSNAILQLPEVSQSVSKISAKQISANKKDYAPKSVSGELLLNNGFESGHNSWSEWTSVNGAPIVQNTSIITNDSTLSANGAWFAYLYSTNTYKDVLFGNDFILPDNTTELTLDYNGFFMKSGSCASGYNNFFVGLYDATTSETLQTVTINDANLEVSDDDYYNYIFDITDNLSGRAGHTMRLTFMSSKNDSNCEMYLALDDVNLTAMIGTPIYRLYNTVTGVHLYTKGASDRDYILNKFPAFEYTDTAAAFFASLTEQAGLTPIYRLYNTVTGVHLYTKGVSDWDYILNKFPAFEFTDSAPAFYASLTEQVGLSPIYRLYNTVTGVHLYTKGVSDRDYILNKFPAFEFTDGVAAFYAELN